MCVDIFDHWQLSDAAIADHYDRLIRRGNRACEAIHQAYGRDRPPVQMRYVVWGEFNASAGMGDGAYEIDISHSIPLLLLILFQRILSDDEVMPWLGLNESHRTDFSVPFVVDLKRFDISEDWHIQLSEIREFSARILADLVTSFVLFHEIGHVAAGHVDALRELEQRTSFLEMDSHARSTPKSIERRQAWEADADALGCTLILEYANELIADIAVNERTRLAFGVPEYQREHILALASAGLFALFFYMRGQERVMKVTGTHPDPYVRAMYCRDMIVTAAAERWEIDLTIFERLFTARAEEFLDALEASDIFDNRYFMGKHFERVDRENDRVRALRLAHQQAAAPWSWIDWG